MMSDMCKSNLSIIMSRVIWGKNKEVLFQAYANESREKKT